MEFAVGEGHRVLLRRTVTRIRIAMQTRISALWSVLACGVRRHHQLQCHQMQQHLDLNLVTVVGPRSVANSCLMTAHTATNSAAEPTAVQSLCENTTGARC